MSNRLSLVLRRISESTTPANRCEAVWRELGAGFHQRQPKLVRLRYHAPLDCGALCDVLGRIAVCRYGVATAVAGETSLRRSVGFGALPTLVTWLARLPGVHQDHRDANQCGLVRNTLPQWGKTPVRMSGPLLASGLNPLPEACQLFQADPRRGALRRVHETLRKRVVRMRLPSFLLAGKLSQLPPGGSRLVSLESRASLLESLPCLVHGAPAIDRPLSIDGTVDDPTIPTKDPLHADCCRLKDLTDDRQVEDPSPRPQVHCTLPVGEHGTLPLATWGGKRQASRGTPPRDLGSRAESDKTIIVGWRSRALEATPGPLVALLRIRHLGTTAYHPLCGQQKLGTTGGNRPAEARRIGQMSACPRLDQPTTSRRGALLPALHARRHVGMGEVSVADSPPVSSITYGRIPALRHADIAPEKGQSFFPLQPTWFGWSLQKGL